MTRRICVKCGEQEAAYKAVRYCKPCFSEKNKDYYRENRSRIRLKRGYTEEPLVPLTKLQKLEYYLYANAKRRAKKKNIEFSITIDDIVIPTHCPVLGLELSVNRNGKFNHTSPSLDRIDNSKGYINGNIEVISNRANILKRDGNLNSFKKLVEYMEKHEHE